MEQYISKSDLVAEIKRRRDYYKRNPLLVNAKYCIDEDNAILKLLDTLEVKEGDLEKDMQDALRTEYEKGRADVIADTLSWLENCWSRYCSNQTIIDGFKEAIKGE